MTHQTTYVPKNTNHLLHLVLSAVTCGAWLPVWACVAIYNAMTKDKIRTVTSAQPGGWYGPVARPYEVGPGAPVSAMNPAPPTPGVPPPPMPPYVGYGAKRPTDMARKLQPFEQDDGLLSCGLLGCTFKTYFGPQMAQHRATPHQAAPPQ